MLLALLLHKYVGIIQRGIYYFKCWLKDQVWYHCICCTLDLVRSNAEDVIRTKSRIIGHPFYSTAAYRHYLFNSNNDYLTVWDFARLCL